MHASRSTVNNACIFLPALNIFFVLCVFTIKCISYCISLIAAVIAAAGAASMIT